MILDGGVPTVSLPRRFAALLTRLALVLSLCASLGLAAPLTAAHADGDPASDVLVDAPPLFLSLDSGATFADKTALLRQLATANLHGHRLRVAVIATRADLGSVTALWGQPQAYAEFLGRELSLAYRGELLVVMPSGFGVSREGAPVRTPLAGLAPRSGQLVVATEQAIERLSGVPAPSVRVAVASAPSPASGPGWWVTTAIAIALIAAAWTASLRARPLARRRASPPGSDHSAP